MVKAMIHADRSEYTTKIWHCSALSRYLLAIVAMLISSIAVADLAAPEARSLSFYNLHTEEKLNVIYWQNGQYQPDALTAINRVLRDHRNDEQTPIDPQLLELLFLLQQKVQSKQPFHVISGYRSPASNELLRKSSSGVAQKSYHTRGMAIDIRLPDIKLDLLRNAAIELNGGGVGYYPRSDFIHLDSGPVRQW